jgi:AcrR family transcriptional regulator
MMRDGRHVPMAAIAAEAGVGVGTLYRKYADREALLQALEYRAYGLLIQILDRRPPRGREAGRGVQAGAFEIADQLVLPLHGAPPLMTAEAVAARRAISSRLDEIIERGRADGSITAAVNATDVIVFSALITQPLAHGPDWPTLAARQLAIFVNGLAGEVALPGPPVTRQDIETAFAAGSAGL